MHFQKPERRCGGCNWTFKLSSNDRKPISEPEKLKIKPVILTDKKPIVEVFLWDDEHVKGEVESNLKQSDREMVKMRNRQIADDDVTVRWWCSLRGRKGRKEDLCVVLEAEYQTTTYQDVIGWCFLKRVYHWFSRSTLGFLEKLMP